MSFESIKEVLLNKKKELKLNIEICSGLPEEERAEFEIYDNSLVDELYCVNGMLKELDKYAQSSQDSETAEKFGIDYIIRYVKAQL